MTRFLFPHMLDVSGSETVKMLNANILSEFENFFNSVPEKYFANNSTVEGSWGAQWRSIDVVHKWAGRIYKKCNISLTYFKREGSINTRIIISGLEPLLNTGMLITINTKPEVITDFVEDNCRPHYK